MIDLARGLAVAALGLLCAAKAPPSPGLADQLSYPFLDNLVSAERGDRIAWTSVVKGVHTVWTATRPDFAPRLVWSSGSDDGQEITSVSLSPDGTALVWVRGGDHDANWAAEGGLQPDPASSSDQPQMEVWEASPTHGPARKVADGDQPVLSSGHRLTFVKDGAVWSADLAGKAKPELSVNYRLGIGYGRAFQHAEHAGPTGSSEYQDVLAGAHFLQAQPGVDPARIGIWGGSYGGLLTALALARDSATFKAGVDYHGVHDWSRTLGEEGTS